jgi:hypothetical protein
MTMKDMGPNAPLARRDMIARLGGAVLAFAGVTGFRPFARPSLASSGRAMWDEHFELAVDLEIPTQSGGRYHRPYVAVWVQDDAGKPVRTISLWVQTTGRGPRYIRELRRWFSVGRDAQDAGGPDLISTVSSATRLPGRYSVTWDGRDDNGRLVEQGTYRVFVEAAREHGTYGLIQQDVACAAKPVAVDLPANGEVTGARIEYRRRK